MGEILRPQLPRLFDTGAVVGELADPAAALEGSPYIGRIFYLRRADWDVTGYPDVISRSEADSYKRRGRAIVLNFEDRFANWCLGGYDVGLHRGHDCARELAAIDCDNALVYMSVDFRPADTDQMDQVMQCLRGFQDSRLGWRARAVYGFAPTLREARRLGLADYFWLCGDGRELYPGRTDHDLADSVNIWQQNNELSWLSGIPVDDDYIYTPTDYGQWMPGPVKERTNMADETAADVQTQLRGPKLSGWPVWRYDEATKSDDEKTRLTLVDLARAADAKLNSRLPLHADPHHPRPVPPEEPDDLFGHVLSARAEGLQNQAILIALAEKAGVDLSEILEPK